MSGFQASAFQQSAFQEAAAPPVVAAVPAGLLFDPRRATFVPSVGVTVTDPRVRIYSQREIAAATAKFRKRRKLEEEWLLGLTA